jgi:hypothetical protein
MTRRFGHSAIADSGATQIFVMEGTPVVNKRPTSTPLKVALADGRHVLSTHMCDITIDGLPTVLTGHIIPELSIASLFGIRVLTEAGCVVTFTKGECVVRFKDNVILCGLKDPATDLWTLPLGSPRHTPPVQGCTPDIFLSTTETSPPPQVAAFAHTVRTRANSIRFAHQALCSPTIATLRTALNRGYLKGCPNLTLQGIAKYLNPSPATAKGHMARPR